MRHKMNRRNFLQSSLITGTGFLIPSTLLWAGSSEQENFDKFVKDTQGDFDQFKNAEIKKFEEWRRREQKNFDTYVKIQKKAFKDYTVELKAQWGEAKLPEKEIWVGYSANQQVRHTLNYKQEKLDLAILVSGDSDQSGEFIIQRFAQEANKVFALNERGVYQNDKLRQMVEKEIALQISTERIRQRSTTKKTFCAVQAERGGDQQPTEKIKNTTNRGTC